MNPILNWCSSSKRNLSTPGCRIFSIRIPVNLLGLIREVAWAYSRASQAGFGCSMASIAGGLPK